MKNFKFLSRPVRTLRRRVSSASGCLPARLIPILLFGLSVSCNHPSRPLFTRMSPSETGIDVVNTNNDTDSLNILDYMYYYNGGGVAIGDINDDGRPDICFTSNTRPVR